jgi:hypothetical protein
MLLQLGPALLLGLFITGVIEQAERRAVLIDELERTRAELAETEQRRRSLIYEMTTFTTRRGTSPG